MRTILAVSEMRYIRAIAMQACGNVATTDCFPLRGHAGAHEVRLQ